jgi:CRISPR-associated protein Csb2
VIALGFTLLAGRYHATAWDHHVNEGTVEWPPAPWRILRALVAASWRLGPDLDRPRLAAVLERLTAPPVYWLPDAAPGHLRHYMPTDGDATTKVFDAFLAVGRGAADPPELVVAWPELELGPADRDLLSAVAAQVAYLGRAESWAEARLRADLPARPADARPLAPGDDPPHQTRLLAALPPHEYRIWRDGYLAAPRGKLRLPETLWDLLNTDTGALQQAGWSTPPGTRRVAYALPEPAARPPQRPAPPPRDAPDFARIVLDGAVLPRVEKSLWLGERLRAALLHHVGDEPCPELTGKDADDRPLQHHGHAYFLPQANDRGLVDQFLVVAGRGFGPAAVRALRALRVLHGLASEPVYTTVVALGRRDALGRPPPQLRPALRWRSLTPFIPPRCPKQRQGRLVDAPEDQLRRLCRAVLDQEPVVVRRFEPEQARRLRLHAYRHERRRGAPPPGQPQSLGFELEFAAPVRGPIALGYGAHFGLGQFVALD